MKLYDITRTLQDAPLYPGSAPAILRRLSDAARGDGCTVTLITADSHLGTHADAPCHFLPDGLSIDKMPVECYCGPCRVVSVPERELLSVEDLKQLDLQGAERVLLHTGGGVFLCEDAAAYLAALPGLRLLGTDALSVGPADDEAPIHKALLGAGIAVVENLILDEVPDGDYILFAPPAKYGGCDGAPVRAILLHE